MASLNVLKSLIRWAFTTRAGDDSGELPIQQVGYLGKVGDSVAWYPYGFHASVPSGEPALLISLQGNQEARVCLPGSPSKRIRVEPGEVAVYHPETGTKVLFKSNGDVEITSASKVRVTASQAEITADVAIVGSSLTHNGVNVGDTHVHSGVQAGAALSGPPQ